MFWHPELKLFLVVYVDDFKLCGPADNLKAGWDLIRTDTAKSTAIKMENPDKLGLFLGCKHSIIEETIDGKLYRGMEYDMSEFLQSCVDLCNELTKYKVKIRKAHTPFITVPEESQALKRARIPGSHLCPW